MDTKYIAFEALRSSCGADLVVQLVDDRGRLVSTEMPPGVQLQVHHRPIMLCFNMTLYGLAVEHCSCTKSLKCILLVPDVTPTAVCS